MTTLHPLGPLDETDEGFVRRAIEISRYALEDKGKTPFGAVLVIENEIIGEGMSSVVELCDPTAHAEVMALRNAGSNLQRHLFADGVLYCSAEPCPLCLAACYWAQVPRLVFGANTDDVATYGFEDLQYYRELRNPVEQRFLREDAAKGSLREEAVSVLTAWADRLPQPVVPKK